LEEKAKRKNYPNGLDLKEIITLFPHFVNPVKSMWISQFSLVLIVKVFKNV